jgi:hypothetical protein
MQVTVVRRGGLAGVALRGDADTSQLPAGAEAALKKLAASGSADVAASHPDGFLYELTFDGQSVTLDESQISDELRPIIDAAMAKATLD